MSMSIQGMQNKALPSLHQQRPVRDVSQAPADKISGRPDVIGNNASNAQGPLRNEGVNKVSDDQVMHDQLASLRVRRAVSEFYQSANVLRADMTATLAAVREKLSGLMDRVHQSDNPEAAERLGAMMDNGMRDMATEKPDRAEKFELLAKEFASRLDAMRAEMNEKYTARTEQITGRADAAIERATAAGNDERVMHIQERLAGALARLDAKAAEFIARLDAWQERFGSGPVAEEEVVSAEIEAQTDAGTVSADVAATEVVEDVMSAEEVSDAGQTDEEVAA